MPEGFFDEFDEMPDHLIDGDLVLDLLGSLETFLNFMLDSCPTYRIAFCPLPLSNLGSLMILISS